MLNDQKKIIVSTGNILNVNKKAGQKTTEEVSIEFVMNMRLFVLVDLSHSLSIFGFYLLFRYFWLYLSHTVYFCYLFIIIESSDFPI